MKALLTLSALLLIPVASWAGPLADAITRDDAKALFAVVRATHPDADDYDLLIAFVRAVEDGGREAILAAQKADLEARLAATKRDLEAEQAK